MLNQGEGSEAQGRGKTVIAVGEFLLEYQWICGLIIAVGFTAVLTGWSIMIEMENGGKDANDNKPGC